MLSGFARRTAARIATAPSRQMITWTPYQEHMKASYPRTVALCLYIQYCGEMPEHGACVLRHKKQDKTPAARRIQMRQ